MASQKTGNLDKTFLGSTYTIPERTVKAAGRGTNTPRKVGNLKQRTFSRAAKGAVTHHVKGSGTRILRPNSPETL